MGAPAKFLFDTDFAAPDRTREKAATAVEIAQKVAEDLVAAEPLGEIIALVKDCFSHLVATPHLVVRINDALYDSARENIERLAKQSGFEGRLVILAEPEIATGDCRIEWADGGVVLERGAIAAKVDELVGRYIASRRGN
jgi:flagellar assembly protein FliH